MLARVSGGLRNANAATDLPGQEIRDLGVARHGFDRTGRGIQPEGMSAAFTL
jgi:hypothetical protein